MAAVAATNALSSRAGAATCLHYFYTLPSGALPVRASFGGYRGADAGRCFASSYELPSLRLSERHAADREMQANVTATSFPTPVVWVLDPPLSTHLILPTYLLPIFVPLSDRFDSIHSGGPTRSSADSFGAPDGATAPSASDQLITFLHVFAESVFSPCALRRSARADAGAATIHAPETLAWARRSHSTCLVPRRRARRESQAIRVKHSTAALWCPLEIATLW